MYLIVKLYLYYIAYTVRRLTRLTMFIFRFGFVVIYVKKAEKEENQSLYRSSITFLKLKL